MLLDQLPNISSSAASGFTPATSLASDPRVVEAARRVLSPLDLYDVGEPPADLASRTLALVARHPIVGSGVPSTVEPQKQSVQVGSDLLHG
jgi:hypothetical protein